MPCRVYGPWLRFQKLTLSNPQGMGSSAAHTIAVGTAADAASCCSQCDSNPSCVFFTFCGPPSAETRKLVPSMIITDSGIHVAPAEDVQPVMMCLSNTCGSSRDIEHSKFYIV